MSNKENVQELIRLARLDLDSAQTVYDCAPACFFSQQAAEKYLKAYLLYRDARFTKTHDLEKLVALSISVDSNSIDSNFSKLRDAAKSLAPYAVDVRYRTSTVAQASQNAGEVMKASWLIHQFVMERLPQEYSKYDEAPR